MIILSLIFLVSLIATLLVLELIALSLISYILSNLTLVNIFTILLSIITLMLIFTLPINKTFTLIVKLIINLATLVDFLLVITTISISNKKKLLNLVKISNIEAKYSNQNNSFIFKLVIFHNISIRANVLLKIKIKVFFIILKKLALDYYYLNINISSIR